MLLVFGCLALSLLATVTNLIPLAICFVALAPLVPYALVKNTTIPRVVVALLAMYAYFLASVLSYAPSSLLSAAFYRRDGNVFTTFLPVVIGGLLYIPVDVPQLLRRFVQWATLCDLFFILVFVATGGTIFVREPGVYHFLFEAHNAAGGYLATVTAVALGVFVGGRRTLISLIPVLVNAVGLALTASRGSIVALAVAALFVLAVKERLIKTMIAALVLTMAVVLFYAYPAWLASGQPVGYLNDPGAIFGATDVGARDANVLDRVLFLWPRAFDLFLRSPIVGTGFGSYNDLPYHFSGIRYLFTYNRPAAPIFDSAHAHNTYLHVLAETGIVGFGLLMLLLREIWRAIDGLEPPIVRIALKIAFWTAVLASMTEHRLFTPSEMLPFTILLGLALARGRWEAKRMSSPPSPALAEFRA